MKKQSNEEIERLEKLNQMFLYNTGYEHAKNMDEKTDKLLAEFKDIEIPEGLDKWFLDYNKKIERKKRIKRVKKTAVKISKKVAVIFIIISLISSIIMMSVEAIRTNFFNMVIDTYQKYSLISHQEEIDNNFKSKLPDEWKDYYYPSFIPDNFELITANEFGNSKYFTFENKLDQYIKIIQSSMNFESQIDTEGATIIEIDVNGNEGMLIEKDNLLILIWNNDERTFRIQSSLDRNTILKIANNLEKK